MKACSAERRMSKAAVEAKKPPVPTSSQSPMMSSSAGVNRASPTAGNSTIRLIIRISKGAGSEKTTAEEATASQTRVSAIQWTAVLSDAGVRLGVDAIPTTVEPLPPAIEGHQ